jgi:DNA-binding response OmpR family regulator
MTQTLTMSHTLDVLIVTENEASLDALLPALADHAFGVRVATSADAAHEMVEEAPPHVILLDTASGIDVCGLALAFAVRLNVARPIVIATTGPRAGDREYLSGDRVHLQLAQPLDTAALMKMLKQFERHLLARDAVRAALV